MNFLSEEKGKPNAQHGLKYVSVPLMACFGQGDGITASSGLLGGGGERRWPWIAIPRDLGGAMGLSAQAQASRDWTADKSYSGN